MGELRGRPEQPDQPTEADAPDPSWNATKDGGKLWRVIRESDDDFAMPGESGLDKSRLNYEKPSPEDRPAERPPNGEELVEAELDDATLADKLERRLLEKETLGDVHDVTKKAGKAGVDLLFNRPTGKAEVCVPMPSREQLTAPAKPGTDGGELLTGMLVVGIAIGEGVKRAHRMRSQGK